MTRNLPKAVSARENHPFTPFKPARKCFEVPGGATPVQSLLGRIILQPETRRNPQMSNLKYFTMNYVTIEEQAYELLKARVDRLSERTAELSRILRGCDLPE